MRAITSTYAIVLATVLAAGDVTAQPAATGRVVDADTQMPLVTATVDVDGRVTAVTAEGRFTLSLPEGRHVLLVTAAGYLPATVDIVVGASLGPPLEVALSSARQYTETLGVVASLTPAAGPGGVTLDPLQVRNVGGGLDNAFYVLQTLPSVAAVGELDPRMAVRGGGPDQNLTMLDGVEVYNPFRLFGLSTLFNPQTIRRIDFAAGGFAAPYGDRLSSLLTVETRDGARGRWLQGQASVGILDSNGLVEGRLPDGSWFVAGRRSYLNAVLQPPGGEKLPDYRDVQAKVTFERGAHRLSIFSLDGDDTYVTTLSASQRSQDAGAVTAGTSHAVRSLRYRGTLGGRLLVTTTASSYRSGDRQKVDGLFETMTRRSNAPAETPALLDRVRLTQDISVRDQAVRTRWCCRSGARRSRPALSITRSGRASMSMTRATARPWPAGPRPASAFVCARSKTRSVVVPGCTGASRSARGGRSNPVSATTSAPSTTVACGRRGCRRWCRSTAPLACGPRPGATRRVPATRSWCRTTCSSIFRGCGRRSACVTSGPTRSAWLSNATWRRVPR